MDAVILHPKTKKQLDAIKAIADAFEIELEAGSNKKSQLYLEMEEAIDNLNAIKRGEKIGRPLQDLLDEL